MSATNTAALIIWAHRALNQKRADSAAAIACALAESQRDTLLRLRCIRLLLSGKRLSEAKQIARAAALELPGGQARYHLLDGTARIAIADGRLEQGIELLKQCLAANPTQRGLHYTLVSLLPHLGRFAEANLIAAQGTLVACGDHQNTSLRAIRFPEPGDPFNPPVPFDRHVVYEPIESNEAAQAIYFVACDSRYFLLFGEALANSLARRAVAPLRLHVHLVNPDAASEALIQRMQARPPVPVVFSRESIDVTRFTERQRRTYLSCVRYLILPALLERYGKPMIVADADQLVVGPIGGILDDLSRHDVAVLRDDDQLDSIFSLISASVLAINHTAAGLRFAQTLRDTVAGRLADPAALGWHLDQAALAVAHLWHREIRTFRLPRPIMDSNVDPSRAGEALAPEVLFWSITMAHGHTAGKLATPLFQHFLAGEPV